MSDHTTLSDELSAALEQDGVALGVVPPGLDGAHRAVLLCEFGRAIDLLRASRGDDLIVGAAPGSQLGSNAELVFVVARRDVELPEALVSATEETPTSLAAPWRSKRWGTVNSALRKFLLDLGLWPAEK